jgi:hypothetical protein
VRWVVFSCMASLSGQYYCWQTARCSRLLFTRLLLLFQTPFAQERHAAKASSMQMMPLVSDDTFQTPPITCLGVLSARTVQSLASALTVKLHPVV